MNGFAEVGAAASGRWPEILSRLGVRSDVLVDRHGPCPGCGGRDRFRFDDRDGSGSWLCSQGGGGTVGGDGFALLGHVHGWEGARQLREVAGVLGMQVGGGGGPRSEGLGEGVAPEPRAARGPKRPAFDGAMLARFAEGCRERVSREWLWARSPICPMWGVSAGVGLGFLSALYRPEERVLVFSDYFSQGDFLFCEDRGGGFRLSQDPRVRAVRSALPTGGPKGVWFLTNPVSGQWVPARGSGKLGRRHEGCVSAWRYAVLESDEACPELWLRALALLDLQIAAIYSSGGRSIHALVRLDAVSKADFDSCRDLLARVLCPLGADGGALSGVRLSRLPGCARGVSGVQELWYLDGDPAWGRLVDRRAVREAPRTR
jgi:hypothetical protein